MWKVREPCGIGNMNEWISLHVGNLGGRTGIFKYSKAEYLRARTHDEIEDGVEEQTDEWLG